MSSQPLIDQYFKSTSGNKVAKNGVKTNKETKNRSKFARSLIRLNNGTRNSAKTPLTEKKKPSFCNNSEESSGRVSVTESEKKLVKSSIPLSPMNGRSCNGISSTSVDFAPEIQTVDAVAVTPTRMTIKSFAKACNSPPPNHSPGKISLSLKRRKNDVSSSGSPPKRALNSDENFAVDHEPEVIEIPAFSTKLSKASIVQHDFPENFDPDIVELSMDDSCETPAGRSSAKSPIDKPVVAGKSGVTPEKRKFDDAASTHAKKNKFDDSVASSPTERKISPNTRKNIASSSRGDSPSNSPWKVAFTIDTPDRSMTALSTDWQNTLDESKRSCRSSSFDRNKSARENYASPTRRSEANDENLLSQTPKSPNINSSMKRVESNACSSLTKSSPRRALFTPKKVRFEAQDCEPAANGSKNSPLSTVRSANLLINEPNSPTKSSRVSNSPTKTNEPFATPKKSPTKSSRSSFSPRVKNSPQKIHKERVDTDIATRAVENLNQAKQGVIPLNDFDLEAIYAKKSFELEYGPLNTNTAIKYEARDVRVPEEKHADHFFMVLVNVFSEPINCGYFNDEELDTVFSILTLRPEAQTLLARMLKRKRGWHRVSAIVYRDIGNDLTPIFRELVAHGFLDGDIENEEMSTILKILQADEIKAVCHTMKVKHQGVKAHLIADLVKLSKKVSLFSGVKSPSDALKEKVTSLLGPCIRVPQRIECLLNRIFILLIPNQDPDETIIAEALHMILQVHKSEKIFPPTPKERFPIFRNRLHLIRYAEARAAWNQIIKASEKPDWDQVRDMGKLAYDRLKPYFESNDVGDENDTSTLPSHVKRFDANYAWIKVLSKSVEAYKKDKDGIDTAVKFLEVLISQRNKMPGNRIRWYGELALIEMHHRKDLETSANVTIEALKRDGLTEVDAAEIMERAKKLLKRSKGITARTKERINEAVRLREEMFISTYEPVVNEIEARMVQGNLAGSKSTWSVRNGSDVNYMNVEQVALRHYYDKGYNEGLHCEGALPITLFATVLRREIYELFVPGAFVSAYQDAPLDLYTSSFFDSRRNDIEQQLEAIRKMNIDCLSECMHDDFIKYRHYQSLMHGNLFQNSDDFKGLIKCLGMNAVVGICERLAGNYNQWKSGFPDLVVWNSSTRKCKIVEVKGPRDKLSTKQRLWIQFLACRGIDVEVCVVKGTTVKYAT